MGSPAVAAGAPLEGEPVIVPPALGPGSVVRVVAPSGPFEPALVWRGLGWLAERYRVRFDRGIFSRRGYLAGDDARRAEELARAIVEPEVEAILCARGGFGASRYVHRIDFSALRSAPRWVVGFSDVTAIHVECASAGVASLHAANVTAIGRADAATRAGLVRALEAPRRERRFDGLRRLAPGRAEGVLFGGNLALLHACAAAGRLRVPPRAVLFVEDVGERPYRIDRMVSTLVAGGHLDPIVAVVVGELVGCGPGPDGVTAEDALVEVLAPLGIPILAGLPCGHGLRNEPLVLGALAHVVAGDDEAYLSVGDGAEACLDPRS